MITSQICMHHAISTLCLACEVEIWVWPLALQVITP